MEFEWDPVKAATNVAKHGVPFELATEVFDDNHLLIDEDLDSQGEYRGRAIGQSQAGLLFVVFTEKSDALIRIISARKATTHERKAYDTVSKG